LILGFVQVYPRKLAEPKLYSYPLLLLLLSFFLYHSINLSLAFALYVNWH